MALSTVPFTALTERYAKLKGRSSVNRLEAARATTASALVKEFVESARAFETFKTEDRFFPDTRSDEGKNPKSAKRTYGWAMAMKKTKPVVRVEGDRSLDFTYVEREIKPTRTKPARPFDSPDGRHVLVDLVLANARTQRPIVGELKIGRDKDPFSGLIQALAGAAQLVSPQQRARLSKLKRPTASFEEQPQLDVYVLLAQFPARNRHRFEQLEAATALAGALEGSPKLDKYLGRVRILQLSGGPKAPVRASSTLPAEALQNRASA